MGKLSDEAKRRYEEWCRNTYGELTVGYGDCMADARADAQGNGKPCAYLSSEGRLWLIEQLQAITGDGCTCLALDDNIAQPRGPEAQSDA